MLTLFVRDRVMNGGTICLEPLEAVIGLDRVPPAPEAGSEDEVEGASKDRIMRAMEDHLQRFLEYQGEAPSDAALQFKKAVGSWDECSSDVPFAL